MQFVDRVLKCFDCSNEFIFTAGEQLFFFDKQFKNDPKRCKLCQAKRAGLGKPAKAGGSMALPLSRTETRTECSACGIETTVPFKPTQGRPVLCRSCFQLSRVPSGVAVAAAVESPANPIAVASAAVNSLLSDAAPSRPAPESSAATMEMIANAPAGILGETETATGTELIAASVEAPQA
jgi:CxxC-x17-CxxC domain-containing protein